GLEIVDDQVAGWLATGLQRFSGGPRTADGNRRVLVCGAAVARAWIADPPRFPVVERHEVLVFVETGGERPRRRVGPQRAFGMRRLAHRWRSRPVPVGRAKLTLERARDVNRRDVRVSSAWEEDLEFDCSNVGIVAHLPRADARLHVLHG